MPQPDLKARAAAKLQAQQERERKAQEKAQKKSPTEADKKVAPAGNESSSLFQSPKIRASSQQRSHKLSANIKGLSQIQLHVSDLGNKNYDWANWINPTFIDANGKRTPVEKKHVASCQTSVGVHSNTTSTLAANLSLLMVRNTTPASALMPPRPSL